MSDAATQDRRAPGRGTDRWFQKPGGSPADRIPAFQEALAEVARAWQQRFQGLAAAEGEISVSAVSVCKVDDVLARRGAGPVLAVVAAPGWNTRIGIGFDRVLVSTVVEALFGGVGDDTDATTAMPLSPVDLQIADVVVRHVSEALALGFAKCLPSAFRPEGLQSRLDPSFLGKPLTAVVAGTLKLETLGSVVYLDILVPLAAMMAFADELAVPVDVEPSYEDPRWTQRLETEISRTSMVLQACVDLDPMALGAIASLSVGQLIALPKGATGKVRLQCVGDDLFRCELGQSAGLYTVRVEEVVGTVPGEPPPSEPTPDLASDGMPDFPSGPGPDQDPFAMSLSMPDLDL
ncbi:FliM/FliN family flagellar motor switch protein [Lichenihabitans sp. Uapishka_5]|uniref:FliM/FliN family flagellar motor switch protein n=1 Tax=Lichenihabitans sp. Uapishka_5 TaxID=3037302 RepID=UPI0029E7FBBF|nr:FliM/FliN family flagellar motor switch protein [Lichenihabitans sp. Uapishka_5]MDX7950347.1 FliM/FliN family flagellar motor switch protein [Lichenihabitans sp. Uapishka_5]